MAGDPDARGKRLLVLGAGPAQLGLLEAARERGLFVIAVDRDPAAPGFRYADRRAILSAEDERSIERVAESQRVNGIIAPGIDWPVGIAARVAARLRLPHPIDPETAALATSKLRQRERLEEAGVPQPRWTLASGPHNPLGYPCVVKAPDRQGQRGLSYVTADKQLVDAVWAALRVSRSGVAMIEEVVEGPEVTVNAVSIDGAFHPLTVTDRLTADPPAFGVALAHVFPSRSERPRSGPGEGVRGNREVPPRLPESDAVAISRAAVAALGIRNGPTYTQLRIGADGPKVMEVAARLGGGHDAELCRAALGVDLNDRALGLALGEPVKRPLRRRLAGGACVRFLVVGPGEVFQVEGVEQALAAPGIVALRIYREPGAVQGPLRTGADRAGAVLAVGESAEEALARADRAADLVRFDMADAEALAQT